MIARLIISPSLKIRVSEINKILSEGNFSPNHPDLLYFPDDSKLGIEQAREINKHFLLKPYQLKGKVVVLENASALTLEAQNALLKTLEEPPEDALLILGAPSENKLLPTVSSRCEIVILNGSSVTLNKVKGIYSSALPQNDRYKQDIIKLLNSTSEERFEYIEKLKEREEFLHSLVAYFRAQLLQLSSDRSTNDTHERSDLARLEVKNFLQELLQAEEWAAQNVNIRAILEYLMLVIPHREG